MESGFGSTGAKCAGSTKEPHPPGYCRSSRYLQFHVCTLPGNEAYTGKFYQPNRILVLVRESLDEDIIQVPISSLLTETVIDVSTVVILNGNWSFGGLSRFCFLKFRSLTK